MTTTALTILIAHALTYRRIVGVLPDVGYFTRYFHVDVTTAEHVLTVAREVAE